MELWLSFWERRYGVLADNSSVVGGRRFACDFIVISVQLRVEAPTCRPVPGHQEKIVRAARRAPWAPRCERCERGERVKRVNAHMQREVRRNAPHGGFYR
jgi:hypothetical protein